MIKQQAHDLLVKVRDRTFFILKNITDTDTVVSNLSNERFRFEKIKNETVDFKVNIQFGLNSTC